LRCGLHTGFGDNHWLDIQARHELDVVHRKHVGGIDHREREGGAYAREWQDGVFLRDFLRNQPQNLVLDIKEIQVY